MNKRDKKRLVIFLILTFSISWSIWILSGVLFRKSFLYDEQWLLSQIGVFAPTITSLIIMWNDSKQFRIKRAVIILLSLLVFIVGLIVANKNLTSVKDFGFIASISVI